MAKCIADLGLASGVEINLRTGAMATLEVYAFCDPDSNDYYQSIVHRKSGK